VLDFSFAIVFLSLCMSFRDGRLSSEVLGGQWEVGVLYDLAGI
jgi:hypothetical protein